MQLRALINSALLRTFGLVGTSYFIEIVKCLDLFAIIKTDHMSELRTALMFYDKLQIVVLQASPSLFSLKLNSRFPEYIPRT